MKPAIMSRSASIRRRFSLRNKVSSKSFIEDSSIRSAPASADTSIGEASITSDGMHDSMSTSSLSSGDHECSNSVTNSVVSNKSCPATISSSSSSSHVGRRPSLMSRQHSLRSRRRRSTTVTVRRLDSLEEAPLDEESVRLASVISLLEQEDVVKFLKAAAEKGEPCKGLGHCRDEDEASSSSEDEDAKSSSSRRIQAGSSSDNKGLSGDGSSSSDDVSLEDEIEKLKAQLRERLMEQQKRLVVGL